MEASIEPIDVEVIRTTYGELPAAVIQYLQEHGHVLKYWVGRDYDDGEVVVLSKPHGLMEAGVSQDTNRRG